ncbi:uncharacterized protein C8A04DRAFT_15821 [Dichotomopilus funicola]|uniref:Uncharacterized protein n=1 Tax=Dichotomopilus funicola TaxID=1934379 RepID=A0AAN6UV42_9PEZI|nr:hypothetical protein C8A04DRAFT_15821 [Dichotomopilus funicola]
MRQPEKINPAGNGNVNPQKESSFYRRLPQEIRNLVWVQLFSSTRIAVGFIEYPVSKFLDVTPAPNSLAALRICRRARLEIGDSWLRHILFYFPGLHTMYKRLSVLPVETITKLRHVRMSGEKFLFPCEGRNKTHCRYSIFDALRRLPGLQLDQLTILGGSWSGCNYMDLLSLIELGDGWKTLRYLDRSSELLGFRGKTRGWTPDGESRWQPQPSGLKRILEKRDGIASAPSVTIYRATESRFNGGMFDLARRVKFEQHWDPQELVYYPQDDELMTKGEKEKEMLIIVNRGAGVDYVVKDISARQLDDMGSLFPED